MQIRWGFFYPEGRSARRACKAHLAGGTYWETRQGISFKGNPFDCIENCVKGEKQTKLNFVHVERYRYSSLEARSVKPSGRRAYIVAESRL